LKALVFTQKERHLARGSEGWSKKVVERNVEEVAIRMSPLPGENHKPHTRDLKRKHSTMQKESSTKMVLIMEKGT